jgi:hypothetical protein
MGFEIRRSVLDSEIKLTADWMGKDLSIICIGGDQPHLGAVSFAEPYGEDGRGSASVSTITALGHRDDAVSRDIANVVCKVLGCKVTVSCGIHYDSIDPSGINCIRSETLEMVNELIELLKEEQQ